MCVCVCVFFLQEICRRNSFIFLFFPIFSFYFLKVFEQKSLFIVTFYSAVETNLNGSDKVKYVINYILSSGCGRDRRPCLKVCNSSRWFLRMMNADVHYFQDIYLPWRWSGWTSNFVELWMRCDSSSAQKSWSATALYFWDSTLLLTW